MLSELRIAWAALVIGGCGSTDAVPMADLAERWSASECIQTAGQPEPNIVVKEDATPACLLAIQASGVVLAIDQVDPVPPIVELGNGSFVAPTTGRDEFGLWSSTGQFLKTVGRRGPGPGEVQVVTAVYTGRSRDTIYVADAPEQMEVFTAHGTWIRGAAVPDISQYERVVFLDSGDLLLTGRGEATYTIVSGSNGEILRSFGDADLSVQGGAMTHRQLAYAGGDSFWSITSNTYSMELWGVDGRKRATIRREVSWFPAEADRDNALKQPYVATFALDEAGVLWVATAVPAVAGPLPPLGERVAGNAAAELDLHVEGFDARTGRLLVSERLDDPYDFVPPPLLRGNRGVRIRPDADGVVTARVVKYKLVTPE